MNISYEDRVAQQIAVYADTTNMHDLPAIFHVWSHNYIRPALEDVFGTGSIDEAYALGFIEANVQGHGKILSIGSGDGEVEIRVAKELLKKNISNFVITCSDISPILNERARKAVQREGLDGYFEIVDADLNNIDVSGMFNMIMANHSLHHIVALEKLFDFSYHRLTDDGVFITCDMIGRNGHMRWPEAKIFVDLFWPLLDEKQKINLQLKRFNNTFIDHDCSLGGNDFEGIRAQDILPLLMQRFYPLKFVGCGGIVDLFVDRGFGYGFDVANEKDIALINSIAGLNEALLDANVITPSWTMASFTKDKRPQKYYRSRSAESSIRLQAPLWVRFHRV